MKTLKGNIKANELNTRFEKSALLLYNAFNKGKLNQNQCYACAVGNLLGHDNWSGSSNNWRESANNAKKLFVVKDCRLPISFHNDFVNTSDYTTKELTKIEEIFLDSFVGLKVIDELSKDNQYNALMNVLEYLAELDNIKIPEITIQNFKSVLIN